MKTCEIYACTCVLVSKLCKFVLVILQLNFVRKLKVLVNGNCERYSPWADHELNSQLAASTLLTRQAHAHYSRSTGTARTSHITPHIFLTQGGTLTTPGQQKDSGLSGAQTAACLVVQPCCAEL